MSYYFENNNYQGYERRTIDDRNYQNYSVNGSMYNDNINTLKTRDNSAILRRAINKKYKEDLRRKVVHPFELNGQYEDEDNYDYNPNYNFNNNNEFNYNNNYNSINNSLYYSNNFNNQYNYNILNNNYNSNPNFNSNFNFDENLCFEKSLLNRINNKKKINPNYYSSTNISKEKIYDEFIINYKSGINYNKNRTRNNFKLKEVNNLNNNYNRFSLNNSNNNNYNKLFQSNYNYNPNYYINNPMEEVIDYNIPYHKGKINGNQTYKDIRENFMINRNNNKRYETKTENFYLRKNVTNDNLLKRVIRKDNYNTFDLRTYNYDKNKMQNNILRKSNTIKDLNQNSLIKIEKFYEHFSKYCALYYYNIIKKIFGFLKECQYKNKYIIRNPKRKLILNKNRKNLINGIIKNYNYKTHFLRYTFQQTKIDSRNYKMPSNKTTDLLINRIKSTNESTSLDKDNKVEMCRDFNELSKKYETITHRKNRLSCNSSFKRDSNNLSFISFNISSVEKNREIWRNNISKEREKRKKTTEKLKKKEEDNDIEKEKKNIEIKNIKSDKNILDLIKKNEILKNKINDLEIKKDENKVNKDIIKNEKIKENKIKKNKKSILERKKIREKYRKKNKKKKTKDKFEMIIVKNLITKDKLITINIKYMNYIPINNKNINIKKNINEDKLYQICNNFNASFFGVKSNNDSNKKIINETKDNESNKYKLKSIREEKKIK